MQFSTAAVPPDEQACISWEGLTAVRSFVLNRPVTVTIELPCSNPETVQRVGWIATTESCPFAALSCPQIDPVLVYQLQGTLAVFHYQDTAEFDST